MAEKKHVHEQRDLSFAELGALLGTREMLRKQLIVHNLDFWKDGSHQFNMNVGCTRDGNCGTVSCIGGTMALIMGMDSADAADYVRYHSVGCKLAKRPIASLFFPPENPKLGDWDKITPKQAIKAIDNFLETGRPLWTKVIKG